VASFVPSAVNRIEEAPDTGYVDIGAAGGYYKLSAVDIHGNESSHALVTPAGTTGVPYSGPASDLSFEPLYPNPARSRAALRFGLPRDRFVLIAVFDARGRRVRLLLQGNQPAGWRTLEWDLRDEMDRPVGAGLYFASLESGRTRLVRRLVIR
jgi:hypothetical protein